MSLSQNEMKRAPSTPGPSLEGVKVRSPKSNRRSSTFLGDRTGKPMRVRIVIAGMEGAGKSCIIKRYCEKRFVAKYLPTVGIDYGATRIFVDKREVSIGYNLLQHSKEHQGDGSQDIHSQNLVSNLKS